LGGDAHSLVVVDMQNYYLKRDSSYYRFFSALQPGCLDYIIHRCETMVIPNIRRLLGHFRERDLPVIFLRLCGTDPQRSDLHFFFQETFRKGRLAGFEDVYPLCGDGYADILYDIRPLGSEPVVNKTTFSPFTRTDFDSNLKSRGISTLVVTGLSTSQCVETTARDASERGYRIIHIEDAQADYDELSHTSSLYSSQGVCGGTVLSTEEYLTQEHDRISKKN
jgi:biuret amidohydrolase